MNGVKILGPEEDHLRLTAIAEEINRRAEGRLVGTLQELRKELKSKKRLPHHHVFHPSSIFEDDDYAFNYGGRTELQFNIGFEAEKAEFRHGVAFSLETSRTLPDLSPLVPKIERFNEFLRLYPDRFSDLLMWHWERKTGSSARLPVAQIPGDLVRRGVFIFIGRIQPSNAIDYDLLMDDWDRLLSLYKFVEGEHTFPAIIATKPGFQFKSGCTVKQSSTGASTAERQLDVKLRHNELQLALHNHLCGIYGDDEVGAEIGCIDGSIDVVVRRGTRYTFYEIKTAMSARSCIRQGLAQILEYSYWPGAHEADDLVIVGEPPLDPNAQQYIERLRHDFSLPISYQSLDMLRGQLVEIGTGSRAGNATNRRKEVG